jgi:hypothetical protein
VKLTLHVGLPKTATTTIQHVLDRVKPELAAQGVLYPGSTKSQLELVQRSQFPARKGQSGLGSLDEAMGRVASEIRAVRPGHVVLSCERMALATMGSVARMQQAIATCLPEVDEIAVLAYVRDPIGWATSFCQQRLKQGTARLAEFEADPWPISFEEMLAKFVDRYGREAVALRYFHPDHLVNGTVVDDFMDAIGLPGFVVPGPATVLNWALSQPGAQVAELVGQMVPRGLRVGLRKDLYRQKLQAIGGPRFVLSEAVQAWVIAESRSDLDYIRRHWGLTLSAEPEAIPDAPLLDEASLRALATALVEEVEQLVEAEMGPDEANGT